MCSLVTDVESQMGEDQKYHGLFFKMIDLTVEEIKWRFQDPQLGALIQIAEILRNASSGNQKGLSSLQELNAFRGLIEWSELQAEVECWRTLSKQASVQEICRAMKATKIQAQLLKVLRHK